MYQGPIGLPQATGRASTFISYSYRSNMHDVDLPATEPAEPQVTYTPQVSDLPVFTGHPIKGQDTGSYGTLWFNLFMFTFRNTSGKSRTINYKYRNKPGSYYSGYNVPISLKQATMVCGLGLNPPGLGQEEAFKFFCLNGAEGVRLHRSWFAVMPYYINAGPMRELRDIEVISSGQSIFGEKVNIKNEFTLYSYDGNRIMTNESRFRYPCSKASYPGYHSFALYKTVQSSGETDEFSDIVHAQPIYPLSLSYTMAVR